MRKLLERKIAFTCFLAVIFGIVAGGQLWDSYTYARQERERGLYYVAAIIKVAKLQRFLADAAMRDDPRATYEEKLNKLLTENAGLFEELRRGARADQTDRLDRAINDLKGSSGQISIERQRHDVLTLLAVISDIWEEQQLPIMRQARAKMDASGGRVTGRSAIVAVLLLAVAYLAYLVRFYIGSRDKAETELRFAQASLQVVNAQLERLAHVDALTDVLNRRGLERVLAVEVGRAKREGTRITAIFVDCDNFKGINEVYGHAGGDLVLRAAAQRMSATIRATDTISRIGGDEFIILLPDTSRHSAFAIAERVRCGICDEPVETPSGAAHLTVSLAIAEVPEDVKNTEDLLKLTNKAIHNSKQSGKNRVSVD